MALRQNENVFTLDYLSAPPSYYWFFDVFLLQLCYLAEVLQS